MKARFQKRASIKKAKEQASLVLLKALGKLEVKEMTAQWNEAVHPNFRIKFEEPNLRIRFEVKGMTAQWNEVS